MLHGIPTPSGGVKTSRLRVFWSELRVHGDQADHWPQFQPNVSQSKVAGNRFVENPFWIFDSERSTKTEATKNCTKPRRWVYNLWPDMVGHYTDVSPPMHHHRSDHSSDPAKKYLHKKVAIWNNKHLTKPLKTVQYLYQTLYKWNFYQHFNEHFWILQHITTTVKTNRCPTGMGKWTISKKGPPKQPGAYETGNLHLGSEMLQVLHRSRKWHVFYHLFRQNLSRPKLPQLLVQSVQWCQSLGFLTGVFLRLDGDDMSPGKK